MRVKILDRVTLRDNPDVWIIIGMGVNKVSPDTHRPHPHGLATWHVQNERSGELDTVTIRDVRHKIITASPDYCSSWSNPQKGD